MFTWNEKWSLRPIVVGNTTIGLSTSAKFPGVNLDSKLNFSEHVTNKITKNQKNWLLPLTGESLLASCFLKKSDIMS